MTIDVVTNHGMHGGSLGGEFSIPLCEWLKSFEERTQFPEIIEAMQTAEKKMFGKISKYAGYGFRAYILHKGGIAIDIPGNATGIYNPPEDYFDPQRKTGCKLKCHNIDTPMQQIALLAGLAALHDRARREIKV